MTFVVWSWGKGSFSIFGSVGPAGRAEEEEEELKEKQGFFSRKTWLAIRYAFIDNCGKRLRNDPYGKSD